MTAEWSYEPPTGPEQWGSLDPAWVMADVGYRQSPVDLGEAIVGHVDDIDIAPGDIPMSRSFTSHGVQLVPEVPAIAAVGSRRLRLAGIHIHTPAEHVIGNHQAAAEIHIVHTDDDERFVVLGVLVDEGVHSPEAALFLKSDPEDDTVPADIAGLLPADQRPVYSYSGSLTTPPCTEGVSWYVFKEPIQFAQSQLEELTRLQGASNRPVQPLHGRRIVQR
ncbi:MAG: carbonic anhydrase family protein [Acidimicrobiia bacterium]